MAYPRTPPEFWVERLARDEKTKVQYDERFLLLKKGD
jgi:hypothetical protein